MMSKVFWYNGVTYTDISFEMSSYGRDTYTLPLETTHYLYFGREKPFSSLYVEMGSTVNAVSTSLTIEYYNGSSWVDVSELKDNTKAFSRNGFIKFDKPTDMVEATINSVADYYIRISVGSNITAGTILQGMDIVFSDDQDLRGVYPSIENYLDTSETSFILRHENSRDLIVQELRNRGLTKRNSSSLVRKILTAWDFLDIEEVRMWSTYLTLANIFSSLQSNNGDFYKEKTQEYREKAEFYKNASFLSIDFDDDGVSDVSEVSGDISSRRLIRG